MSLKTVTIVSGILRSGTAMMMQMLEKGGLPLLTDNKRLKDNFNPKGYFEYSEIRTLNKNKNNFLEKAVDKGLKVYAGYLPFLPLNDYVYKVIFMERDIFEAWASKRKLLIAKGKKVNEGFFAIQQREKIKAVIEKAKEWIDQHPNIEGLYIDYNEVLKNPLEQANRINNFLGNNLSSELMAEAVLPELKNAQPNSKFLITDRAPVAITKIINQYAVGKVYCEVGIGEGHNLNATTSPSKIFGVELEKYGVNRCKKLYPHIEVIHGDILKLLPVIDFDICYMWIIYPMQKDIINAILEKNENTIILAGLNYFYHLDNNDEKAKKYINAYPALAQAKHWNQNINKHLDELKTKGINYKIHEVIGENDEIFSIAAIQK